LVGRFAVVFLTAGILAGLILWFGAAWIIRIILREEFLAGKDTARILTVSAAVLLVMTPLHSLPAAVVHAEPALKSVVAAIVVQVIVIFWLVPRQGAMVAAWANFAYVLTWAVVLLPSVLKVLRVSLFQHTEDSSDIKHTVVMERADEV